MNSNLKLNWDGDINGAKVMRSKLKHMLIEKEDENLFYFKCNHGNEWNAINVQKRSRQRTRRRKLIKYVQPKQVYMGLIRKLKYRDLIGVEVQSSARKISLLLQWPSNR